MTRVEIIALILLVTAPLMALIVLLPKRKKKGQSKSNVEKTNKTLEPAPVKKELESKAPVKQYDPTTTYKSSEFADYLASRALNSSRPKKKDLKTLPPTTSYVFDEYAQMQKKSAKMSLADEINSLSPELKALIVAGVLDKKDFSE